MYTFGKMSRERLASCDDRLQRICWDAIDLGIMDFSVICGYRNEEEQNRLFHEGKTKLGYPNSKHNKQLSHAVDLVPYPIDWSDHKRFHVLAGIIITVAKCKAIDLRWGGDWDGDMDLNDQSFIDLPHFELVV
jgi:peptidoglycan L-alanyl-D-glutamate endopeptidase CwlK